MTLHVAGTPLGSHLPLGETTLETLFQQADGLLGLPQLLQAFAGNVKAIKALGRKGNQRLSVMKGCSKLTAREIGICHHQTQHSITGVALESNFSDPRRRRKPALFGAKTRHQRWPLPPMGVQITKTRRSSARTQRHQDLQRPAPKL